MADITITDVTYTIQKQGGKETLRVSAREKMSLVKIEFGDSVKLYKRATGVPFTDKPGKVGLLRQINRAVVVGKVKDGTGLEYIWHYDNDGKNLFGTEEVAAADATALTEIANATAIVAQVLFVQVYGW